MTQNSKIDSAAPAKTQSTIPNGRLLLESIGLTRERLNAGRKLKVKVAVPAVLFKELLSIAASTLPFDEAFYLSTYPDIKAAHEQGLISDAHTHFVQEGFIEGRFGSKPDVDEEYYTAVYTDVKSVISGGGGITSALEHYLRSGAFEGRIPNSESEAYLKRWLAILGR